MPNTVIGLFANLAVAHQVERALEEEAHFAHDRILVAASGSTGRAPEGNAFVEALVEHGVPRERARLYAEGVRAGGAAVILFDLDEEGIEAATRILRRHRPLNPERRLATHHETGYPGYAPVAQPFSGEPVPRFADEHPAEDVGVVYVM